VPTAPIAKNIRIFLQIALAGYLFVENGFSGGAIKAIHFEFVLSILHIKPLAFTYGAFHGNLLFTRPVGI
jgi:hypothetical protein